MEKGVSVLRAIFDNHAGVQDRFRGAGILNQQVAENLGAVGLAARASGIPLDLRVLHPWSPYDRLKPMLSTQSNGDVAARVQVRFDEIFESIRLCRLLLKDEASGPILANCPPAETDQLGIGVIESLARAGDHCA